MSSVVTSPGAAAKNPHPDVHDIRDLLSYRLARLGAGNERAGQHWMGKHFGVKITEFRVLGLTCALEPLVFREAARLLVMDKGQLSRIVKALVESGLVSTTPLAGDLRTVELTATPKGRALMDEMMAVATARNRMIVADLTAAETRELFRLLEKIQTNVDVRIEELGVGR